MEFKKELKELINASYQKEIKPIKVIKNKYGFYWNANDGKETYSGDIVALLNLLGIDYELKDETYND